MKPGPFFCALLFCFSAGKLHAGNFIHRTGNQLTDSTGKTIQLNGVNLGGWLMWEAWIWGKGFVKETKIDNRLVEVAGKAAADSFRTAIYNEFITEADIKAISKNCFNVVRVPFNHRLLEDDAQPGVYKEAGFKILDRLCGWCEKYGVYVVLDMHGSPGGNSGFFTADPDKKKLWEDEKNIRRTARLWKAIAARYAGRRVIAGYDLLNEPGFPDKKKLLQVYHEITDSIRRVDKNHLLIYEGNAMATDFSMLQKLPDENCALSFHIYTFVGKSEKRIRKLMDQRTAVAKKLNAPNWCGEWGENDFETMKLTRRILLEPGYNVAGVCSWTWKKVEVPNNLNALNAIAAPPEWKPLIYYLAKGKKKPAAADALKAMHSFPAAARAEKNVPNTAILQMLGWCKGN